MQIVLASESRFRKHALDVLGLKYVIQPSGLDESLISSTDPSNLVMDLAKAKALTVAGQIDQALVIAGDAIVALEGRTMGKPKDRETAELMLQALSGKKFDFVAGLAVYNSVSLQLYTAVSTCTIRFRTLQDAEIKNYVTRYAVTEYAGAFEVDGVTRFSVEVMGELNFTSGFPMCNLIEFLRLQGVTL